MVVAPAGGELRLEVIGDRARAALAVWRSCPTQSVRVWLEDGAAWVEPAADGGYLLTGVDVLVDGDGELRAYLSAVRDRSRAT